MSSSKTFDQSNALWRLKEIIAEVARVDLSPADIEDDANLYEKCALDSVTAVDLFIAIEDRFNIELGEGDLDTTIFKNLGSLRNLVESKLSV
jgi:acyl carrier protein